LATCSISTDMTIYPPAGRWRDAAQLSAWLGQSHRRSVADHQAALGCRCGRPQVRCGAGTIKFALGENVKQANWGDNFTKRYPQTRMGVEQIDPR
jgi:hypothetical protein